MPPQCLRRSLACLKRASQRSSRLHLQSFWLPLNILSHTHTRYIILLQCPPKHTFFTYFQLAHGKREIPLEQVIIFLPCRKASVGLSIHSIRRTQYMNWCAQGFPLLETGSMHQKFIYRWPSFTFFAHHK